MLHGLALNLASVLWCTVSCDTLDCYICPTAQPQCQILLKALICSTRSATTSSAMSGSEKTLLSTVTVMFAVILCGILQGVVRPESVYSIMPQWWHLIVLQYAAASFHLPSVSTANINTVQYTKPYQQYEIPTIPAVVISKVLLPQSIIIAAFVHCHSNLFFDKSPGLPTNDYHEHNLQLHSLCPFSSQTPACCVQISKYSITFYSLNPYWSYFLRSSNTSKKNSLHSSSALYDYRIEVCI